MRQTRAAELADHVGRLVAIVTDDKPCKERVVGGTKLTRAAAKQPTNSIRRAIHRDTRCPIADGLQLKVSDDMTNGRATTPHAGDAAAVTRDERALTSEMAAEPTLRRPERPGLESLPLDLEHHDDGLTFWCRIRLETCPPRVWTEMIGGCIAPRDIGREYPDQPTKHTQRGDRSRAMHRASHDGKTNDRYRPAQPDTQHDVRNHDRELRRRDSLAPDRSSASIRSGHDHRGIAASPHGAAGTKSLSRPYPPHRAVRGAGTSGLTRRCVGTVATQQLEHISGNRWLRSPRVGSSGDAGGGRTTDNRIRARGAGGACEHRAVVARGVARLEARHAVARCDVA